MQRCGVVWEINRDQGCRSAAILQRAGADRTTTVTRVYCSARCLGAIQTQVGSCEETGRGGVREQGRQQWGPGAGARAGCAGWLGGCLPFSFEMMFVLWHPAVSIVISHNIIACFVTLTIRVASHKRIKRNPGFTFSPQKCCLPFYFMLPCFPGLLWYFTLVCMTLQLVTNSKCVFSKGKIWWESNSQSQFLIPKSVPQSCSAIWSYFYLCKNRKRKELSKVKVTGPGEVALVMRLG